MPPIVTTIQHLDGGRNKAGMPLSLQLPDTGTTLVLILSAGCRRSHLALQAFVIVGIPPPLGTASPVTLDA
ncbi:hypothetical protein PG989_011357 [Apiospora arundinis]